MIPDIDVTAAQSRFMQKYCDRYCYFGSSSKSETHQVQSNKVNPLQMQQYQDNYAQAQQAASTLKPYTGEVTAGFNPNQIQAQGILSSLATDPRYQATNRQAMGTVQGVLDNPQDAAQLAGTDLSQYYNPFQKDVIDASVAQNERARQIAGVANNQHATAAHAFGGSRHGVADALTNEAYDRNNQQNIAGLNTANFGQAQQAALADIAARNNFSQFNSNQKLQGAGLLADLNNNDLRLATQQGGILSAVGDTQQAQEQKRLGDLFNLYAANNQLTLQQQQLLNQALGIIPLEQTNTTDGTTTTKSNPGLGGILGGVASLGLAAATGGTSMGLSGALGGLGGLFGGSLKGQSSGPSMGWT